MFPLRCTVACEIFSKSSMGYPMENFFIGEVIFPTLLPSRGSSHANTPLPRENFPSGKEIFLAPMFSLRCIVAFEFFFLSPNAHLPMRRFQNCPVFAISTWRHTGGCFRRGVLGPDVCSLMFVCSNAKNYPPRISHRGKPHVLPTRRPARFLSAPMFPPAWRRLRAVFPRTTGRCPMNPSRPRTAEGVAP